MNYSESRPLAKLEDIKKYLEFNNWEIEHSKIKNLDKIYKLVGEKRIELLIPNNEGILDYNSRIKMLIESLSLIDKKDYALILEDINNIGYNLIKIKFESPEIKRGSIPLSYAEDAIFDIKNLITYGACSVINPQNRYRRPYKEAANLVKNCELGKSEEGSFIITIKVPSDERYLNNLIEKDLGKKTIVSIISGISDMGSITINENVESKLRENNRINKNMCDAISNLLVQEEGINLELSALFSSSNEIEEKLPSFVKIDPRKSFKVFNKASLYLKGLPEQTFVTLAGKINKMQKEDIEEKKKGVVYEKKFIRIYSEEKGKNIHILLNDDSHRIACDAYKLGKNIEVEGLLNQKQNGFWYLDEPKKFKMLKD